MMVADAVCIGICFNNIQSNALSDIFPSLFHTGSFIIHADIACSLFSMAATITLESIVHI